MVVVPVDAIAGLYVNIGDRHFVKPPQLLGNKDLDQLTPAIFLLDHHVVHEIVRYRFPFAGEEDLVFVNDWPVSIDR